MAGDDNRSAVPSPTTVLYVDDERSNRIVFEHAFNKHFDLVTAASASEALTILETSSIGVLVTDQRMPGMTGNQLLMEVKERWPGVVRIVITAYSDFDALLQAVNDGLVARYIVKPWEREELLEVLRWACEVHLVGARDAMIRERLLKTERLAMLGTVADAAMHDMSQPLVALLNNSEALVRYTRSFPLLGDLLRLHGQLLPRAQRQELRTIIRDLPELATDLFDAAKVASAISKQFKGLFREEHQVEAREADPVRVVDHALAVARPQLPSGARGRYVGPDLLPPVALAPTDLFRVLANLIINAAEALSSSPRRGGIIEVDARVDETMVELVVRDDGPGMSPEAMAKATKEYFTTRAEGTGLGLTQCRRIVEGSGGTMAIESVEGEGTTVTVRVPRSERVTSPPARRDAS
ncbi:MAG TPA: hybrid sensor histidine kinase/response regulator [Polyangiaceae bacterium]|nr:hybrid sensor histidine kinase/response regulator [Polyangiaceae bacterium]